MAKLWLDRLTKYFGHVRAVLDLSLEVEEGELVAFLGPSGCGKTTTLRMIAGFETPTSGRIIVDDEDITHMPPELRKMGMVFQNYALFPHLTVFENVAYGLRMRNLPRNEIQNRVKAILERVHLWNMADRYPRQLSGGQQQRTALARALVINPQVLLLDEPLANLDAKLREDMRFYIRDLQQSFGITTIYVTHDQSEAFVLANRIAVMMDGVLQQFGTSEEVYRKPINVRVADFLGLTNMIEGEVRDKSSGVVVETPIGIFRADAPKEVEPGRRGVLLVRPEAVIIRDVDSNEDGQTVEGRVIDTAFLGNLRHLSVVLRNEQTIKLIVPPWQVFTPGDPVGLEFQADQLWFIPEEEGESRG